MLNQIPLIEQSSDSGLVVNFSIATFVPALVNFGLTYFKNSKKSGDGSQVATSGEYSKVATSGNGSRVAMEADFGVGAAIGPNSIIKGKKGCWITLAEYDEQYRPICVKSAQIDGKKLKEDVWYRLKNGEFVENKT